MTTKTRYFMLGSFAVLVAGLCTGLVAYYGGLPTGAFAQKPGPAELVYVPSNAAIVAYADVQEVMSSELRRRLNQVMPPGEANGREEFKRHTGIDIEHDIDHVVACMVPRSTGEGEWNSGFVVFRGRFDNARLESLAREHGATTDEYKGKRLIRLPAHVDHGGDEPADDESTAPDEKRPDQKWESRHGPRPDMTLAFVEPGLVMFGDERTVKQAIDTAGGGRDVTANVDMVRLVKDVDGDSNAWAVGRFDVIANRAKLPEGISSQIPPVKWFAAAARVNGGVSGKFTAEARDEEAARNLRDVANGFLALGRMQAGSRPELQGMLQSLQLSGVGNKVELSFSVPTELIDAIAGAAKAQKPRD